MTIGDLKLEYPIYLPDATRGVVKSLDSVDLLNLHIEGVVVNTFHLKDDPGLEVLAHFGGVKKFMNYSGLVTSDSGGWQVFSLIRRNPGSQGYVTDDGVVFSIGNALTEQKFKSGKKTLFTPYDSIKTQLEIGSDIVVCLDDFTSPVASPAEINESVKRTVLWAKKSREAFDTLCTQKQLSSRPLLMAVIQGGWSKELRKECAQQLIDIGFDAYGFGGYVIDDAGKLDYEMSEYICNLIPQDKIKFALGTGRPIDIATCSTHGWQIFDCTLPTRDARHKRLYTFTKEPFSMKDLLDPATYGYVYINKGSNELSDEPVCSVCDCLLCKNYSRAYLKHLFDIKDNTALRLATIHNLRHYTLLTNFIKKFRLA